MAVSETNITSFSTIFAKYFTDLQYIYFLNLLEYKCVDLLMCVSEITYNIVRYYVSDVLSRSHNIGSNT